MNIDNTQIIWQDDPWSWEEEAWASYLEGPQADSDKPEYYRVWTSINEIEIVWEALRDDLVALKDKVSNRTDRQLIDNLVIEYFGESWSDD